MFLSINPPHIGISTSRKGPQTQTVVTVCGSLPTNYDQARDHGHNKTSVQTIAKTILSLRVVENNDRTQMATLQRHCPLKCHSMNFLSGPAHTQTTIFSTSEPCDLYRLAKTNFSKPTVLTMKLSTEARPCSPYSQISIPPAP